MTKKIILISCSSRKSDKITQAQHLYTSDLFKSSLAYAKRYQPDKIFILSARHHLLDLETVIGPYDVTLTKIPKLKRRPGLTVLTQSQKIEWGIKVIQQLSKQADLKKDTFVILAGAEYIAPIKNEITNLETPLKGKKNGERLKYLKTN